MLFKIYLRPILKIIKIRRINYFYITFPPLIILQNENYYKTMNNVISFKLNMTYSAVSVHSPKSSCSLSGFEVLYQSV